MESERLLTSEIYQYRKKSRRNRVKCKIVGHLLSVIFLFVNCLKLLRLYVPTREVYALTSPIFPA